MAIVFVVFCISPANHLPLTNTTNMCPPNQNGYENESTNRKQFFMSIRNHNRLGRIQCTWMNYTRALCVANSKRFYFCKMFYELN